MEEQAGFYFLAASSGRTSYSPTTKAAAINATPVDAQLQLPYMLTPSFPVYKAWWNMTRSSKQHFDHLFIIYYITFDYKLIIIVNYI